MTEENDSNEDVGKVSKTREEKALDFLGNTGITILEWACLGMVVDAALNVYNIINGGLDAR